VNRRAIAQTVAYVEVNESHSLDYTNYKRRFCSLLLETAVLEDSIQFNRYQYDEDITKQVAGEGKTACQHAAVPSI
jgi:hypothetical protein